MEHSHPPTFVATVTLVAVIVAVAVQGCAHKQSAEQPVEHTVRKVPTETPAATPEAHPENATGGVSKAKDDFAHTINRKLEELDVEISELETKIASRKGTVTADWTDRLLKLESKRKAAQAKLDEIRRSTGKGWEHLQDGAREALENLEQAVKENVKDF